MTHHTIASPRFRGEIVQKIYRVWLFRKLLPVLVAEIAFLSFVIYQLGKVVFIQRILENALNVLFLNPEGIVPFTVSAFNNAPTSAKVFGVVSVIVLALVIRHITQGVLRLILVRENYFSALKKR